MTRTINGHRVFIRDVVPRMQVSAEFARLQSPKLVEETNAWMASFFGYTKGIPDGEVRQDKRGEYFMNSRTYDQYKAMES